MSTESHRDPVRILHAEDQSFVAQAVGFILRNADYEVEHVRDGQEALEKIQADPTRYRLLLTDDNMPRLSGLELVGKLRELNFPGKIVVLSGMINAEKEAGYQRLKVDGLLEKPFRTEDLVALIARALSS